MFYYNKAVPYFRNARKEITKTPVFYFSDLGLRNYAAGDWGNAAGSRDAGFVFENLIMLFLREIASFGPYGPKFWRSKDGYDQAGDRQIAQGFYR